MFLDEVEGNRELLAEEKELPRKPAAAGTLTAPFAGREVEDAGPLFTYGSPA